MIPIHAHAPLLPLARSHWGQSRHLAGEQWSQCVQLQLRGCERCAEPAKACRQKFRRQSTETRRIAAVAGLEAGTRRPLISSMANKGKPAWQMVGPLPHVGQDAASHLKGQFKL